MREKSFVSFVVYVYNAEDVIQDFVQQLDQAAGLKFDTYEIILVNDHSMDATKKKIKEISGTIKGNLTVLNLAWK
ncbi:MAG: glycosyltransferase, partial [Candidatus Cloacimonetes bacterium]|nr:glycosyltransferase [Candidatus Cloacimonadota bacterium]